MQITGDDYPTYEDSVNQSLKEKAISDSIERNANILKKLSDKPLDRFDLEDRIMGCLLYTSPSPRDRQKSRMPSSA